MQITEVASQMKGGNLSCAAQKHFLAATHSAQWQN